MRIGLILLTVTLHGPVTYDRLLNALKDPANWMTYPGG
jgi:hypothetical protein